MMKDSALRAIFRICLLLIIVISFSLWQQSIAAGIFIGSLTTLYFEKP